MKGIAGVLAIILVVGLVGYGLYHVKRWFNWEMAYSDAVQETVCEMVKPEYLKNSSLCD